jgi:hypothetical protein
MVAMSLGTIPGCVAVGLVDEVDRKVLAAWCDTRVDLELAVDVFEQLVGDTVVSTVALLAPDAGAPRDLIVVAGGHVHLFDRVSERLCFVAVCRVTGNLTSMVAAFRISRGLMEGQV